jgi:hypothetical protein
VINAAHPDYQINEIDGQFFNATYEILEGTQAFLGISIEQMNANADIYEEDLRLNQNT